MIHHVLARKWRPKSFNSMVGQEHVLQALVNALDQKRLHHAYLFTGTRGVGKTTIARILAKCLNCEAGISSTPCEKCSACLAIDAGRAIDLIEVDAASRTKVEDTRELLDNVQYAPASSRFKIYLIDEVHMLSGHSFNALLKTLEEPPSHVKFLLATTDPQKLPVTVLSRCLQFHLKNLLPELIAKHLAVVLTDEKISFERAALDQLAKAADGSMRDALSLLDQAISFGNGNIKSLDVHAMLGTLENDHVLAMLKGLSKSSSEEGAIELLTLTEKLTELGIDFYQALEALLSALHQLAVLQAINANANTNSHSDKKELLVFANQLSKEDIQLFYQIALLGRRDLPLAPSARIGFEMTLLRMLDFRPSITVSRPATLMPEKPRLDPVDTKTNVVAATNLSLKTISADWETIIADLALSGMALALASNCELVDINDNKIELTLLEQHSPLLNPTQLKYLETALQAYFNKPIVLSIAISKAKTIASPAKNKIQQNQQKKQKAQAAIESDPAVAYLLESFQASVDNASIHFITEED